MRIETERLVLRQMTHDDFAAAADTLKDIDVMYAWEHAFSDEEVSAWIDKRLLGYKENGFDYMLAVNKINGEIVGQIGLIKTRTNGADAIELGYILSKKHWNNGYAREGARACTEYAFNILEADRVIAAIRPENTSSVAVAKALGMLKTGQCVKNYNGKIMPHDIYEIKNG